LDKEIIKKNNIYASFIVLTLSLGLLFIYATTIQPIQILVPVNAAETTNATQQGKSAANQTGETLQSFANKTGEALQKINPLK
jgi:hypothetical protein